MGKYVDDPFWDECLTALSRPEASELVANGPGQFFVTMNGQKQKLNAPQMHDRGYVESMKTHLAPLVNSYMDFDEKDGYIFEGRYVAEDRTGGGGTFSGRCHIAFGQISYTPRVTLTKIASNSSTLDSLASSGSMSTEMLAFLKVAVQAKLTIVLSGQTGAGKTTTLQAMTKLFDPQDRVGVAEDVPELLVPQPNVFYLHTRPWVPGLDPNLVADLSFVVRQFQRERADRIIIGETRGKEFAEFLVAANSGMKGSLTTLHAEDPSGALDKMTRFALAGSDGQPIRFVNKEIGTAVDLVVQLGRIKGRHRVTHIQEVTNIVANAEDAKLSTQPLYEYNVLEDNWTKVNMMTDKLKRKFELAEISTQPFLAAAVKSKLEKHSLTKQQGPAPVNEGSQFGGSNPFGTGRSI